MQGTTAQRIGRVVKHLVCHPSKIIPYARYSLMSERSPMLQELPWIAWDSINAIRAFIKPGMKVFEYGTGGSTFFFARLGANVYTVENDQGWYDIVQQRLKDEGLSDRVELHYLPFSREPEQYRQSDYLHAVERGMWDLVLIDGYKEHGDYRQECLEPSWQHLNPGGMIVYDDIWMFPDSREKLLSMGAEIHRDTGPARFGVTETAILRKK